MVGTGAYSRPRPWTQQDLVLPYSLRREALLQVAGDIVAHGNHQHLLPLAKK